MQDDVDMDAPQISTLREEETPEPQPNPNRTSKFRVKLLVGEGKRVASTSGTPLKVSQGDSEDDDDDDEEDQLIDDDDEEPKAPALIPSISAPPVVEKKGTVSKRGVAGTGRGRGRGRGGRGASKAGRADVAQPIAPTPSLESIGTGGAGGLSLSAPAPSPRKRGGAAAKTASTRGGPRKRAPKQPTAVPPHMRDDAGSISEAYAATAASSPAAHDDSPDTHDVPLPQQAAALPSNPSIEDVNLEGVPLPSYPLPSRPFPVHPPQKIGTGFAPIIPLDKSGKDVRHWRQANREIRGIAGGRWFVKSWVGEQESEYASAVAAIAAAMQPIAADRDNVSGLGPLPIPRLPGLTLPLRGAGRPKVPKSDIVGTNPSSRAQSIESTSAIIPKKRTSSQMAAETPAVSAPTA